ncbi:pyocin knob domain-containing protein [Shinella zoogloeoides]|uniref:pyocin knob domain-containing protein n=1 Tax=Shinella zoogloeoides TaxID=352475 RepID=UPI00273EAE65|nr:pyocin knob domain-containing protein [Shinella zoogloeoides]WLR94253.1 pyocin knob domain-containing protein [Shinella zoogloeoides]
MTLAYTTGTITLTNGSKAVTGIGTGWQTALIAGGVIYPDASGNALPIKTVNSNTSITVDVAWKGATGTYSYAIVRDTAYLQQLSVNAQALATYISRLDSASLGALAALAGTLGAGKVPRGLSGTTMEWFTVSDFMKTVLDDADFAAALATLGADSAANLIKGIIPDARLPTRLINSTRVLDAVPGGWDTATEPGWYTGRAGTENAPGGQSYMGQVMRHNSAGFIRQELWDSTGTLAFYRFQINSVWQAWRPTLWRRTAVGTVSQDESSAAIVQRGSNANGEFVRFADGTQICWKTINNLGPINQASGTLFISGAYSVGVTAASFVGTPVHNFNAAGNGFSALIYQGGATSFYLARPNSSPATDYGVAVVSTGRWF